MYDSRIVSADAGSTTIEGRLAPIENMLGMMAELLRRTSPDAAPQGGRMPAFQTFADRYRRASPVAQRRIDAVIREAATEGTAGLRLIIGCADPRGTAARVATDLLHARIISAVRRIDWLLPAAA